MPRITIPTPGSGWSVPRIANTVIGVIVGVFVLSLLLGSWYTVNQTERTVLLRNGAFVSVEQPGLHFKLPMIDSAIPIGIYQRTTKWDNSTGIDYRQEAYTSDQQPAKLSLTVLWHIPEGAVDNVYRSYRSAEGMESNLIFRRIPQDIKTVIGTFTAVSAIQDRAKLNSEMLKSILDDPDIAKAPVVIDGVQLEDVELSKVYIDSVEAAMQARVEVQRREQQRAQEKIVAEITVIQAKAKADAVVAQANADATSTKLRGEAEASAIKAKGDALRENPQLVDLTKAERWNGILPTTMLPGGTIPFLSVPTK